jgi:hypothetical protein
MERQLYTCKSGIGRDSESAADLSFRGQTADTDTTWRDPPDQLTYITVHYSTTESGDMTGAAMPPAPAKSASLSAEAVSQSVRQAVSGPAVMPRQDSGVSQHCPLRLPAARLPPGWDPSITRIRRTNHGIVLFDLP